MGEKLSNYSYSLKKEKQRKAVNIFLLLVVLFIVINLLISFLIYPVRQVSVSMNPDIPENSLVMVSPLVKSYQRGDIVLLNPNENKEEVSNFKKIINMTVRFFTAQQLNPAENEYPGSKNKIRRIVGLPGDTIYMRDYVLYIKKAGEKHYFTEFEITDKTYNVTFYVAPGGWDSSLGVKGSFDEITLGKNQYFVLGDNRKACDDSRLWGPVTIDDFSGKVLFCYFPFKNINLF